MLNVALAAAIVLSAGVATFALVSPADGAAYKIETATTGATRRGEPLVHLLGTERRENGTRTTGVRNATNWSFSVAVTPESVVRSYSYSYEGTLNGESVTVTEEFRLKPSEARTVDRPAWVSTAVEQTNESRL